MFMRKMITLIAAAALVASPFAFAEETTGNPNDVLQTVPGQETAGPTIAENAAPVAPANADAGDSPTSGSDAAAEAKTAPMTATKHKHHAKKHHKHHHHKSSSAPSSDSHMSKEEPTSGSGTDMSAPAAAPTGQ
jgi:hypothetical protein